MEISIINGSPRKNGATALILQKIEEQLRLHEDVKINYFNLGELSAGFCKGCEVCYSSGYCIIKSDGLASIAEQVKKSDALVIGTPTHGSNVSAVLKNFMDRGHFILEQALYGKKCLTVCTYEIADGVSALKALNKFIIFSGGSVAHSILTKVGFNKNPLSPSLSKKKERLSASFYQKAKTGKKKSLKEYFLNDIVVVGLIWKPYFKKNISQFRGVIDKYKKAGLYRSIGKL